MSKYLDLIPIESVCQMAARSGVEGLPPNSLIAASMKLAQFLRPVYERIRTETLDTQLLLADETTHRMLEGDEKSNWFLGDFLRRRAVSLNAIILVPVTCLRPL